MYTVPMPSRGEGMRVSQPNPETRDRLAKETAIRNATLRFDAVFGKALHNIVLTPDAKKEIMFRLGFDADNQGTWHAYDDWNFQTYGELVQKMAETLTRAAA